jgi:hypothetical protein
MTQARIRFSDFGEYLAYSDEISLDGRYELIAGELIELPPESRLNSTIAIRILLGLMAAGISVELLHPGKCEVQVPFCDLRMLPIATLIWWFCGKNIWNLPSDGLP